jgi:hypothetical protein
MLSSRQRCRQAADAIPCGVEVQDLGSMGCGKVCVSKWYSSRCQQCSMLDSTPGIMQAGGYAATCVDLSLQH